VAFTAEDPVLSLKCPIEGQYISEIKAFGFLKSINPKTS
jgi:hypothetical protein